MNRLIGSVVIVAALTLSSCGDPTPVIDQFQCAVDEGLLWHDVYVTSQATNTLSEVKLRLTVIGENGEPRSEERYYATWQPGQTLKISLSVYDSPANVQKVEMAGSCSEGKITALWPSPPRFKPNRG